MPKMKVVESIQIEASQQKVHEIITDLSQWGPWSPWLTLEPGVKVIVSNDGNSYSWEGNRVGSGEMRIISNTPTEVKMDLQFLTPYKSQADIMFQFSEIEGKTTLTWNMESALPFFMFWMKKMMEAMLGMDFQRGLLMLKDYIELGEVPNEIQFDGISNFKGVKYIGIRTQCASDEVGPKMQQDLSKVYEYLQKNNLLSEQVQVFSVYHKMDFVKKIADYTTGMTVNSLPANVSDGLLSGELPATKVYEITHRGPYRHLGNPWTLGYMMARNKEFKMNKSIPPFEIYVNDPSTTEEKLVETKVCFPAK